MSSDQQPPPSGLAKSDPPGPSPVLAPQRHVATWTDPDWQRFWLTVDKVPWHALAIIPAGEGGPPDLALSVAVTLSRTGMSHLGGPIQVADGTQVPIQQLNGFLADVRDCIGAGQRVIIALSPAKSSPTVAAIAKFADCVLLCVALDHMRATDAQQTVSVIGASKFLGSVILRLDGNNGT